MKNFKSIAFVAFLSLFGTQVSFAQDSAENTDTYENVEASKVENKIATVKETKEERIARQKKAYILHQEKIKAHKKRLKQKQEERIARQKAALARKNAKSK